MIIQAAGYLSGIVILLSFVPYIKDIFLAKTKPERASWLIWAILGSIAFFSQLAKGASYSLFMAGAQAVGDLLIFSLAIKYGLGGLIKRDIIALGGAAVALWLWYLTHEAAVALFIVILIDATGAVLTIIKAYEKPATETISSWVLTFVGGFLACIAVGQLNFILLAFPAYICLASLSILLAIKLGFKMKSKVV
ncbi:MAG: hypothetical protein A3A24_03840 [Candidatus Buchananbacteria bacterium RIFCSPLOWO2_01_FULL_46_12]|uniref:Uncharacterized protein n=2 Tax=Candidatus Buchananiibacteriota TaxID=1817903 RepID=A0A1G1YQG5_9BACT|nr:MAG: hypothetical protein A2744_03715 [Candidatus Buchananbacteria bacterium RIFCSPHIGHO2_01_FULL_44_11]OGY53880.1 MAG: hypothetical protein A3A24_03840 [Candidatus Buchananbacteria bacterium RIFCSPLOWO2_01_FULL_46_12]